MTYPLLASAATAALHYLTGLSWRWAALVAFVGWPLIGTLVTLDDDLPGGWSNPGGTIRPAWLTAPFWGRICLGAAVASFVAALDLGWSSSAAGPLAGIGALASVVSLSLLRRRSAQNVVRQR